jgi:hypothetical protein
LSSFYRNKIELRDAIPNDRSAAATLLRAFVNLGHPAVVDTEQWAVSRMAAPRSGRPGR